MQDKKAKKKIEYNRDAPIANILKKIDEQIYKAFDPDAFYSLLMGKDISQFSYLKDSLSTHILSPCLDILSRGGKRLRPLLLILFTQMLSGDEDAAYKASAIIEGIHNASLIHDDIEDGSLMRRGEASVHIKYGVDVAINAACALYFFSLKLIENQKEQFKLPLYQTCTHSLALLHKGQAMDIKQHNEPVEKDAFLTEKIAKYQHIARLKTGTLFSLAFEASLIFSCKEDSLGTATQAVGELGVAFQMLDDIVNISCGNKGKDRGDDIVEGKWSFPIVLYLEQFPNNTAHILQLFDVAKKEGINSKAVNECCTLLEESGVLQEGMRIAKEKMNAAFVALQSFFGNKEQLDMMREIFECNTNKR